MSIYNIYCDESCHLEHDGNNDMVLGAVWCPQDKVKEINRRIREIKAQHGVCSTLEVKWTKLSPSMEALYADLVNYFFDNQDLHFRCLVVPDKSLLDHGRFEQSHDDWYYKMYFDMLKIIFHPHEEYEVYIDVKDTHSHSRAQKLREVCSNTLYDFSMKVIRRIQPIRSHEVQIMQIVDILIGAVCYQNRVFPSDFPKSQAKVDIVNLIKERSQYLLTKSTLYREEKFNILVWEAR